MHILEIPSFFPPLGGAFSLDQAKALQARGHEVRMIVCNQLGIKATPKLILSESVRRWEEDIDGVRVYRTNMYGIPRSVYHNQKRWCRIIVSMYHDYVRKYGKPDILHAHCCKWAGVAASMIAKEENIPFYITEHLSSVLFERDFGHEWNKDTWAKDLLTKTYHEANCVIPVSEELVENLAPFFGKAYRYIPVSNIIDTDFYAYKERTNTKDRKFRFCCLAVANIHGKGYDVLAEAMRGLDEIELHIAGRGTDSKEMRALFSENSNIVFHGELDKYGVRDLLYKCDALVLASRCEAQPLVILEAMSTGIPMVGTEVIPQSERIEGACLIAKTGNAESLRDKMMECKSIKPSKNYANAVRRMASPEIISEKLETIFYDKDAEAHISHSLHI